ncbi:hypothetical protein C2I18_25325 [Paenibacillus sp. PK3_47]|uniref:hypothetical protein n=1 Tax=Paenibacillus sp. PK3_47 TaxID=2072642 RepID=UPI00201D2F5A|nr:hypothetical protein [Paenibacillus sp. PK3_47]UQZ36567.1 hypothetical protein C2I18_25325 [Paenibacillus sp. PK3_47]
MTNHMNKDSHTDSHTSSTDEAWTRLQASLAKEPVNPVWAAWGQQSASPDPGHEGEASNMQPAVTEPPVQEQQNMQGKEPFGKQPAHKTLRRPKMNRRRKWTAAAAAALIVGAVLATPVGNTAMAAILNQFRMQEGAVIEESDLRNIFYQVNEGGAFSEADNKFGIFTTSAGDLGGELPVGQLQEKLGYSALSSPMFDSINTVYVMNSRDATLTLNVDEVNQALMRLGSDQLLPQSVDGKPITLHMPEVVSYNLSADNNRWAYVTQMNTPTITVDPSIDVTEALKAVLNFPLLPDQWKNYLEQSRVLSGEIPMPLIKGETAEELTVGGTLVIMDTDEYGRGANYRAVWVKDGQMFEFSGGDIYQDKEEYLNKLQELISQ